MISKFEFLVLFFETPYVVSYSLLTRKPYELLNLFWYRIKDNKIYKNLIP